MAFELDFKATNRLIFNIVSQNPLWFTLSVNSRPTFFKCEFQLVKLVVCLCSISTSSSSFRPFCVTTECGLCDDQRYLRIGCQQRNVCHQKNVTFTFNHRQIQMAEKNALDVITMPHKYDDKTIVDAPLSANTFTTFEFHIRVCHTRRTIKLLMWVSWSDSTKKTYHR